jgi:translation initiation factor 1
MPVAPPRAAPIPPEQQVARLSVEKRKKSKVVSVVRGLPAEGNDLSALLSRLQSHCGAGGTIKEERLEIQGDHRDRIRDALRQLGFRVQG